MKWIELSVEVPPEYAEPVSTIFYRYGHGGVAIEQAAEFNPDEGEKPPATDRVRIVTYLPNDSNSRESRSRIDVGIKLVAHFTDVSPLQERLVDEEDWKNVWKEHFHVLYLGRRIVVVPTWRSYEPRESDVVISLDPGMAFGTGHHPTTRMCIELLEGLVKTGMDVLDLGCGSGILSIAAVKLGAGHVVGLDIDTVAIEAASANVANNNVDNKIALFVGSLPHDSVKLTSVDIVLANIATKVVSELSGEIAKVLRPGGILIASGILFKDKEIASGRITDNGLVLTHSEVDGDWMSLIAEKSR